LSTSLEDKEYLRIACISRVLRELKTGSADQRPSQRAACLRMGAYLLAAISQSSNLLERMECGKTGVILAHSFQGGLFQEKSVLKTQKCSDA
jgi:hypothetical protein